MITLEISWIGFSRTASSAKDHPEHEALHILVDELGLADEPDLNDRIAHTLRSPLTESRKSIRFANHAIPMGPLAEARQSNFMRNGGDRPRRIKTKDSPLCSNLGCRTIDR